MSIRAYFCVRMLRVPSFNFLRDYVYVSFNLVALVPMIRILIKFVARDSRIIATLTLYYLLICWIICCPELIKVSSKRLRTQTSLLLCVSWEYFKLSFINRLYFRYFFFYFLTNNIKHVNMYLYLYINKDQRPKTEFKQFWNASRKRVKSYIPR